MHGIDNNTSIAQPNPPPTGQAELERALSRVSAARSVAVADQEKKNRPSFQYFSILSSPMIFSRLRLRDVVILKRVCKRLRNGIHQDNALAKAWYRRFPSPLQYQLRTTINTKNVDQLCDWFRSFTNDQALVKSITDRKTDRVYVPALLFFTLSRLMSECETFVLDTTTINEANCVNSASLSVDGRHLVTASDDGTAKIYVKTAAGSWELIDIIRHTSKVNSASFSPDGSYVVTASNDGRAIIYGYKKDGSWKTVRTISHSDLVYSATFSANGSHVLTASNDGTAQVYGLRDDGSWERETTVRPNGPIKLVSFNPAVRMTDTGDKTTEICGPKGDGSGSEKTSTERHRWVLSANFSSDGRHLVTAGRDNTAKIFAQKADGSWEPKKTIRHGDFVHSAVFSPDGRYLVTASEDDTARIYRQTANGSWEREEVNIYHKDGVLSANFSPDGRHVVTASRDGTAKIIGLGTDGLWSEKACIYHNDWVLSANFSIDSRLVVTASSDHSVKITELRRYDSLLAVTE
ncbi:F-box/WD repeat-containing protein [Endozoicomonas sp. ALD040]|uniref:F-box/WD repeat-containing protein n=1 Tax=Endozoicomonas sp. ALD040 TaxID=3403079 RepID=UPI003BB21877